MTNTVKNLLMDAVFHNNTFLAYAVYIAVQKNIVTMDDEESKFYAADLPFDEIQKAVNADSLFIERNSVKLYLVRYKDNYAMYLAKSKQEAEQLHFKLFKEPVQFMVNATHKKSTSVFCERRGKNESFYDMQERAVKIPMFCGLMESKNKNKKI